MNAKELLAAERRRARQAVTDFVEGAISGDTERMSGSFNKLDYGKYDGGGWRRAFTKIAGVQGVPDVTREYFLLQFFLKYGDHMRQETCDDLIYTRGLRALLPPYEGPAVQVYRGEGWVNRKHRTYGCSWSSTREVAHAFAKTWSYHSEGGGVLLSTIAPPEAIICAPALDANNYGEQEYIIDRRRLGKVQVEERFPQITHEEYCAQ